MGDLFHTDVDDATLAAVFGVIAGTARHTYLVLTKRPARMADWLRNAPKALLRKVQGNLWLGVSVEDQQRANERLPLLTHAWPGRRIACLEPLLDRIDLSTWLNALDWVIAGGETGSGGRQADAAHLREVRDQCVAAGVPLFFKQWGGRKNKQLGNTLDGKKWEQLRNDTPRRRSNEPSLVSNSGGDAGGCEPTARGCPGG
jgi:protein gp37